MGRADLVLGDREKHDEILASHILRTAELSYKMEIERGDSLASSASRMLTAISVVSIALVTLLPTILTKSETVNYYVVVSYRAVFLLLVAAFVLCLISQFRFKYKTLVSPSRIAEEVEQSDADDPFNTLVDAAEHYCASIESSYVSVRRKNDIANLLMRAAVILMLICCGIVAVDLFIMLPGFWLMS